MQAAVAAKGAEIASLEAQKQKLQVRWVLARAGWAAAV